MPSVESALALVERIVALLNSWVGGESVRETIRDNNVGRGNVIIYPRRASR